MTPARGDARLRRLGGALSLRARYASAIAIAMTLAFAQYALFTSALRTLADSARVLAAINDVQVRVAGIGLGLRSGGAASHIDVVASLGELGADERLLADADPRSAAHAAFFADPERLDERLSAWSARALAAADTASPAAGASAAAEADLLGKRIAAVVNAERNDVAERSNRLRTYALTLFASIGVVLAGVALAIFRPLERRVADQQQMLVAENDALAAVVTASAALATLDDSESLQTRYLHEAEGVLGTPLARLDAQTLGGDRMKALAARARERDGIAVSPDGGVVALALPGEADATGAGAAVYVARRREPFRRDEVAALDLVRRFFQLARKNHRLYADVLEREARVAELDQFKSDLIAMLTHDFRNALTAIIGYADVIGEGDVPADMAATMAASISANAWKLSSLATDTLTMAQLERNEMVLDRATIDLRDLVREATGADDRLRSTMPDQALAIDCDPRRIRQILDNLLENALKYSPDGAPVDVRVGRDGDRAYVAVRDRGIGIPAAECDRIFGRFFRASNAKTSGIKGTGFGLYICRMIARLHGGDLSLSSREGDGSEFRLTLPLATRRIGGLDVIVASPASDSATAVNR